MPTSTPTRATRSRSAPRASTKFGIDANDFSGASLDGNDNFHLAADKAGDVQITHPGGTIALHGIAFTDGLTFAELGANDLFQVSTLTEGTDQADNLTGTDGNDVINAKGGNDVITPGSGDDIITTGAGHDQVNIDPSNPNEGHDTITDFSVPSSVDSTSGDFLGFKLADILAADPNLPAADGDANSLSLDDLDKSGKWTLSAAPDGSLLFTHPNGSVDFSNIAFNDQHFADLGSSILVDGREFTTSIPVESTTAGGTQTTTGGEQTTTGGEQTTTEQTATGGQTSTGGGQTTTTGGEQTTTTGGGQTTTTGGEQTTTTSGEQTTTNSSQHTTSSDQAANGDATSGDHTVGGDVTGSESTTGTEQHTADAGHIGDGRDRISSASRSGEIANGAARPRS